MERGKKTVNSDALTIDAIPVNGGDSFLIMNKDQVMLIDTGYEEYYYEIAATLNAYNIKKIDTLVLTHYHPDHIGGASRLFSDYEINQVILHNNANIASWYNQYAKRIFDEIVSLTETEGCEVTFANEGYNFNFGEASCRVLSPSKDGYLDESVGYDPWLENEMSVVLKLDYFEKSLLFTGDIGDKAIAFLLKQDDDLSSEFLKLPHHGSTFDQLHGMFIRKVNPSVALITQRGDIDNTATSEFLEQENIDISLLSNNSHILFSYEESGSQTNQLHYESYMELFPKWLRP